MNGVGLERDDRHRYYWHGDGPIPSATTILRVQDSLGGSDGLTRWAAGLAAEAAVRATHDGADALSAAYAAVGRAAAVGTLTHAAIEDWVKERETTVDLSGEVGVLFRHFLSWAARARADIEMAEEMVVSFDHRYAGTLDFIARVNGRRAMVDVKTGKLKASHRLQLAAYSSADGIGRPGEPELRALPHCRDHYVLLLSPAGYDLVPQRVGRAEVAHFRRLARMYEVIRAWPPKEAAA